MGSESSSSCWEMRPACSTLRIVGFVMSLHCLFPCFACCLAAFFAGTAELWCSQSRQGRRGRWQRLPQQWRPIGPTQVVKTGVGLQLRFVWFFLRHWRRGNLGLIATLSVQHLQPRCPAGQIPPSSNEEGTAKAQSLQHIVAHLLAVLRTGSKHLLAQEIPCRMTAQSCPRKLLVFKKTSHLHARTA